MYKIDDFYKKNRIRKKITKIIGTIVTIVLSCIILFNFTLIIQSFINPNATPNFMGIKTYTIVSGSMQPFIKVDDVIIEKSARQHELKVNDIITFKQDNMTTTHRIVSIIEENGVVKYTTKGDNNNVEDQNKISFEQIEGKYWFKISGFGNWVKFLQNKITLLFLVCILVLSFYYNHITRSRKEERKQKRIEYENKKALQ